MKNTSDGRYLLIDGIRGIAIVNMVLFHFLYDCFVISGRMPDWPALLPVRLWQNFICQTFILVSGLCWHFGVRGNLRRGITLNLFGLLVSLVTLLAVPQQVIWFGILNCIGCCVLIMIPLHRILNKPSEHLGPETGGALRVPPLPGMAAALCCFALTRGVPNGFVGIDGLFCIALPRGPYRVMALTILGFRNENFYSSDYFPLIPWLFLYLAGYFLGALFLQKKSWQETARKPLPLLSRIGRYSIWIYLIHQPVCMLLCELLLQAHIL